MPRLQCKTTLKTKTRHRVSAATSRSLLSRSIMRKRKYCNISSRANTAAAVTGLTLMRYQDLSPEECLVRLLARLDKKNVCQKFRSDEDNCTPTTHNMVSTIHIKTNSDKIDLDMISGCIPNSAYNKKRFAAITIRIDEPKTTALLFSSGKLVITGASSKQMAIAGIRSTMYMLQSIFPYIDIAYTNHTIQNIVCNVQIRNLVTIDIKRLHKDFGTSCTYQVVGLVILSCCPCASVVSPT